MTEPATNPLTADVRNLVTSPAITYDLVDEPALGPFRAGWLRFVPIPPAMALSVFLSTASVLADPRTIFATDSSVLLESLRRGRQGRRVSLAEAREIALDAVRRARARSRAAAELEGADFRALFGWNDE